MDPPGLPVHGSNMAPGCEDRLEFQGGLSQGTPEVALVHRPPASSHGRSLHPTGCEVLWGGKT